MKLLVTGSASHLADVLLPALFSRPEISQVIGMDLKPARHHHPKYQHYQQDVRGAGLQPLMHGVEAVIHLAFVVLRSQLKRQRHDRELIRDINVNGSIKVFETARDAGVKTIVHLSSAAVYGAWPDNPPLIKESQPRRVMTGFSYAEDKNAVEDWLDELNQQADRPRIVRLRPHVILGHSGQPFLSALLRQPFYPRFPRPAPLTQCVWETDVVEALVQSLFTDVDGAFNLAAEPAMSFEDMLKSVHRLAIPLPFSWLRFSQKQLWRFTSLLEEPGWLEGMPYSLALDCQRAKKLLGWQPRHPSHDCVRRAARRKSGN